MEKHTSLLLFSLLLAALIILPCGCSANSGADTVVPGDVVAGDGEDESRLTLSGIDDAVKAANVSCETLTADDIVTGYVLSFDWTSEVDEWMSNGENVYFARIGSGKNAQTVPMEYVKVLNIRATNMFRVTVSLPEDISASQESEVSFCLAHISGDQAQVIFTADAVSK